MTIYTIEKYKLNSKGDWMHDNTEYYMNKKIRNEIFMDYLKILVHKKIEDIDFKKGLIDVDETGYHVDTSIKFAIYFLISALSFGLGIALSAI